MLCYDLRVSSIAWSGPRQFRSGWIRCKTLIKSKISKQGSLGLDNPNCIVLAYVNKSFGQKQVLKDINLDIPYGNIYGLLGPSGCGKNHISENCSLISEATSGEIYVLGQVMPSFLA